MKLCILKKLCGRMTVAQLERELGFSNGSIAKWERTSPSIDKVQKVADYFGVSIDYIQGKTDDANPQELEVPEVLKKVLVAFNKQGIDELTQEQADKIAEYTKFVLSQSE